MATQKQIDANRRNSVKSTGPVSDEGKKQSRRNALKHGLAGSGVVLPKDDVEAIQGRMAEWSSSLKPFDPYEMWMLEVVAIESIRVERCRAQERLIRDEQMERAEDFWGLDRRLEAEELASKLGRDPSVLLKLRSTLAGATILLERWQALAILAGQRCWTSDQESLAYDMLGTPGPFRDGPGSLSFGESYQAICDRCRKIADEQVEQLKRLISEILTAHDDRNRELRRAGLPDLADKELQLLNRYEASSFRRLSCAYQQMQKRHRSVTSSPESKNAQEPLTRMDELDSKTQPVVEVTAKVPQPQPPPKPVEPPVVRRPYIQDVLSKRDLAYCMKRAGIKVTPEVTGPLAKKAKPRKDVPSPNDRPSRRA